ncbi:MAG TPA: hypothetical protein VJB14_13375, partial [Planctomycetota bacterium]|nr:hypothetical protein [Planctomycetota bacterium]
MGDGSNSGRRPSDTRLPPTYPPLGKFNLIREIGRGAMGVVYEGLDTVTRRKVAVKLLNAPPQIDPRESKPAEDRFLREARLSASIAPHPAIVAVLEAGVIE